MKFSNYVGMEDPREAIMDGLKRKGRSMSWLSQQFGKNRAYIQQFIERGTPHELDLQQNLQVSELLDIPLKALGVPDVDIRRLGLNGPKGHTGGFNDDAAHYEPPPGSILSRDPVIDYWVMKSDCLINHPLRIQQGDILVFDLSAAAIEAVKSEQIVLVQCYDKNDFIRAQTLIREFIRPNLITTNRDTNNEIFNLDDNSLPFEPHVRGVFRNLVRG